MIKNNNQYNRTLKEVNDLILARNSFIVDNPDSSTSKYQIGINSFDSIISDLSFQIDQYQKLSNGGLQIINPKTIENIPEAIIQTRIALGLSQKAFAKKVGLKEQQIQRYEAENFQGISFERILNFTEVLGLKFYIEKTIISINHDTLFSYGDDISEECIEYETRKVKERRSLLIS